MRGTLDRVVPWLALGVAFVALIADPAEARGFIVSHWRELPGLLLVILGAVAIVRAAVSVGRLVVIAPDLGFAALHAMLLVVLLGVAVVFIFAGNLTAGDLPRWLRISNDDRVAGAEWLGGFSGVAWAIIAVRAHRSEFYGSMVR